MNIIKFLFLSSTFTISVLMATDGMSRAAHIGELPFNPQAIVASLEYQSTDIDSGCIQYTAKFSDDQTEVMEICK